jgi:hypothetical protein
VRDVQNYLKTSSEPKDSKPKVCGMLFDLPQLVQNPVYLTNSGLDKRRWATISGDFFQSVPKGGDTYILKRILHDCYGRGTPGGDKGREDLYYTILYSLLKFSAGKYKNIHGEFSKVPVNSVKIGAIIKTKKPAITNDVVNDPRIKQSDWAMR